MPIGPCQDGSGEAVWLFGSDVSGDLSEAFVYDQSVAAGHVHKPDIGGCSEPCRKKKYSIAKAVKSKKCENRLEA